MSVVHPIIRPFLSNKALSTDTQDYSFISYLLILNYLNYNTYIFKSQHLFQKILI